MQIDKVFDLLEKIEQSSSDLYRHLQEEYRNDSALSDFFSTMHNEEEGHLQIVRMERRIVQASPKAFSEPHVNLSEINSILQSIAYLKTSKLELPKLIGRIYEIESSMAERYLIDAIKETNEDLRGFLLQLGDTCSYHLDKVATLAIELGVNIEDMEAKRLRKARVGFGERVVVNKSLTVRGADLSEGGMFLLTGRSYPVGETLSLQFSLLEKPLTADAVVQYTVEDAGIGVRFTNLPDTARRLITQFVEHRLEARGLDSQKHLLLVGNRQLHTRNISIYMNELLGAGYKVMEVSGIDETLDFLRKRRDMDCAIIAIDSQTDLNYFVLNFLRSIEIYREIPVLVVTHSQNTEFREDLMHRGVKKILDRISTSPKRLVEEIGTVLA
jgi:CheY-like chemotaxis protein/rubrerythrin